MDGGCGGGEDVHRPLGGVMGLEHVLPRQVHEEHAHVLHVNLAEGARDGRVEEHPHGGDEGHLHGHLVLAGHGAVEREEGAEDVAQFAGRLRHRVVPDQQ